MLTEKLEFVAIPAQVKSDELVESVTDALLEKGYQNDSEKPEFKIEKPELRFEPYYFFHYDAIVESESAPVETEEGTEGEDESEALDESSDGVQSGVSAIHAINKEFNEEIASLIEEFEIEPLHSKKFEKPLFSLDEIQRIIKVHLAAKLKTKRENIELSAVRLAYVPFYSIAINVEGDDVDLVANGATGEINGLDAILERGKSGKELAGEAFRDLGNPQSWILYPVGFLKSIFGWLYYNPSLRNLGHYIVTNRRAKIALLVIITAFIILRLYRLI